MKKDELEMNGPDPVEEISAKLREVANMIRASGLFASADVTTAFFSVAAMSALTDFGPAGAAAAFRDIADELETEQLQGRPN
jgi:hypothetical protein